MQSISRKISPGTIALSFCSMHSKSYEAAMVWSLNVPSKLMTWSLIHQCSEKGPFGSDWILRA